MNTCAVAAFYQRLHLSHDCACFLEHCPEGQSCSEPALSAEHSSPHCQYHELNQMLLTLCGSCRLQLRTAYHTHYLPHTLSPGKPKPVQLAF